MRKISLLGAAFGLLFAVASQASAADPFHYSAWCAGRIDFGSSSQPWFTAGQKIFTTNPDTGRSYFCQNFGFFNCQVQGPTDTWIRARVKCWSGAIGSSNSTTVFADWSRQISSIACPSGFPNVGSVDTSVASIPFSNFTCH